MPGPAPSPAPAPRAARGSTTGPYTVIASGVASILEQVPVAPGTLTTRRVFAGSGVSIVELAFDAGQVMAEHRAGVPILVQVAAGRIALSVDGETIELSAGGLIHVDAGVPHSLRALDASHALLMLCGRAERADRADRSGAERSRAPAGQDARE